VTTKSTPPIWLYCGKLTCHPTKVEGHRRVIVSQALASRVLATGIPLSSDEPSHGPGERGPGRALQMPEWAFEVLTAQGSLAVRLRVLRALVSPVARRVTTKAEVADVALHRIAKLGCSVRGCIGPDGAPQCNACRASWLAAYASCGLPLPTPDAAADAQKRNP